jgi:predicted kinase
MKLIVLNGPSGIGKSTTALELQKELPLSLLIDIDALRRYIEGYKEHREESAELSYKHALALTRMHLECGHSVIVEKTVLWADWFLEELEKSANEFHAEFFEFILTAQKDILLSRVTERGFIPGGSLTLAKVEEMWEESEKLPARRPKAVVIDTSDMRPQETLREIKNRVGL